MPTTNAPPGPPAIVQLSFRSERTRTLLSCLLAIRALGLAYCGFVCFRLTFINEAICVRPARLFYKQTAASNLDLFDNSDMNTDKQEP